MIKTKWPTVLCEQETQNYDQNSHLGLSLNYISSHFDFFQSFRLQMICIFKFRHDRTNVYNWEGLQTYIMESCLVANFCETEFQLGILKMTLIPVPARLDSDSKDQNTIEPRWLKQNIVISKKMIFQQDGVFCPTGAIQLEHFNWRNVKDFLLSKSRVFKN